MSIIQFPYVGGVLDPSWSGDMVQIDGVDTDQVSDGYHTFHELYEHRTVLFALVTALTAKSCWRSKFHSDGTMFDGMFIVGMDTNDGPVTYHCDLGYWDLFEHCRTLENAPAFDGHTPQDVVDRLAGHLGHVQSIVAMVQSSREGRNPRPQSTLPPVDNSPSSGI